MKPAKPDVLSKSTKSNAVGKLPRLPKRILPRILFLILAMLNSVDARIQKRPILRPAVPSPYAGADQQKVIYVSAKTPFVAAVKRVRKLLDEIEKRSLGKFDLINGAGSDKEKLKKLGEQISPPKEKKGEEVVLKATNRAIEKLLGIALFFQGKDDCRVHLRTGTIGVVDDIVEVPDRASSGNGQEKSGEGTEEELPESRVRKMTFVEAAVTLK